MIAVLDYGMGNLKSVAKALEKVGLQPRVTSSPRDVDDAGGVVLPGVGAFRDCVDNLDKLGLIDPVLRSIRAGKPFLGICLGLQVLFSSSEEFGRSEGLGVFPGKVVRFPDHMPDPDDPSAPPLKVPHMGWNQVEIKGSHPVLEGIASGSYFYFVHSYHVVPDDPGIIATTTSYGIEFVSSIATGNVYACQFHPEKSQNLGLTLLRNFGDMVDES